MCRHRRLGPAHTRKQSLRNILNARRSRLGSSEAIVAGESGSEILIIAAFPFFSEQIGFSQCFIRTQNSIAEVNYPA